MAATDVTGAVELPRRARWGSRSWRRASRGDRIAVVALGLLTVIALLGPVIAPHDPTEAVGPAFDPPSVAYPFGTNDVGMDMFSRVLVGLQSTWLASLAVIGIGVLIGGAVGLAAGASGGWIDSVLMRITDVFLALPAALLAIVVVTALGPSLFHLVVALSIFWWPYYARIVRSEIRANAALPHVEAARLSGSSRFRIAFRHLMPSAMPVTIVAASLDIAQVVLVLATLSFLGLGAPPPAPELGSMVAQGSSQLLNYWWVAIIPAIAVLVLSLVGNLAGDAIRDMVDER
jgi:ABC-type dipeptide/oligopeptide/nickel transport system permease subunit